MFRYALFVLTIFSVNSCSNNEIFTRNTLDNCSQVIRSEGGLFCVKEPKHNGLKELRYYSNDLKLKMIVPVSPLFVYGCRISSINDDTKEVLVNYFMNKDDMFMDVTNKNINDHIVNHQHIGDYHLIYSRVDVTSVGTIGKVEFDSTAIDLDGEIKYFFNDKFIDSFLLKDMSFYENKLRQRVVMSEKDASSLNTVELIPRNDTVMENLKQSVLDIIKQ